MPGPGRRPQPEDAASPTAGAAPGPPPRYGQAANEQVQAATSGPSGRLSAGLAGQLRAAFGASGRDPSRPDTAATARGLGVSQRQVQRYLRGEQQPSAVRVQTLQVAAQLRMAFGASARNPSRPDTAAAARALGISQRQVQRYLTGQAQPGPQRARALDAAARRGDVADARAKRSRDGMRVTVTGVQGVNREYAIARPPRTVTMRLDGPLADGYYAAYETGGAPAALAYLENNSLPTYLVDSWHFERVDRLTIRDGLND